MLASKKCRTATRSRPRWIPRTLTLALCSPSSSPPTFHPLRLSNRNSSNLSYSLTFLAVPRQIRTPNSSVPSTTNVYTPSTSIQLARAPKEEGLERMRLSQTPSPGHRQCLLAATCRWPRCLRACKDTSQGLGEPWPRACLGQGGWQALRERFHQEQCAIQLTPRERPRTNLTQSINYTN